MQTKAGHAFEIFKQAEGREVGVGQWQEIAQERINQFADATLDHQFIHTDPERAAKLSPYKTTIAHGFLTLSLIPHLNKSLPMLDPKTSDGMVMGINYGLDKVRFPAPVKVNAYVRARVELISVELKGTNTLQLKHRVTVEIKGEEKPGCVAETLSRLVYE